MSGRSILAVAMLLALAAPARATVLGAGDILTAFNVVTKGNLSTSHDIEGPALVGGNLTGSGTFFGYGQPLPSTLAAYSTLNIYGNAAGVSYNVNAGAVKVASAAGANSGAAFNNASSVSYAVSFPYLLSDFFTPITTLSTVLKGYADTGTTYGSDTNNMVITAKPATVGGVSGVAVVNISSATLCTYAGLQIALGGASTVIINVSGNLSCNINLQNTAAWRSNVIWNFYNASSLSFGAGWEGTVIAPSAGVTNSTAMEGGLAAASFTGNGELHYVPFTGSVAFLNAQGSSTPAPEPASLLVLAGPLASLTALRRRRA